MGKLNKTAHDWKSAKKEKDLAQKRQLEKIQKDLEELDQDASKKPRYSSASPTVFLSSDIKMKNDSSESSSDSKDFALEMDACAVCKDFSSDKGAPVECQECHNMYHRECHQPPISHQDASDPRCVWYCSWCTKNMKKVAKQINSKSFQAASNPVQERISSLESKNKAAFATPFKRHEIKTTPQSSTGNGSTGGSLAGWAALSGKSMNTTTVVSKTATTSKSSSPNLHTSSQKPVSSSSPSHSKDKTSKSAKPPKAGQKFAVSDDFDFAKALGGDLPSGSSKPGSNKSGSKLGSGWGGNAKPSVFPKATASSSSTSKSSSLSGTNAEKRIQSMKKKAKMNPKKSKV